MIVERHPATPVALAKLGDPAAPVGPLWRAAAARRGKRSTDPTATALADAFVPLPVRGLCLDGALAKAEPKTVRYRLLHTAARIVRGQRKHKIRIPETWPWAPQPAACLHAALAIPPPT
jgi:hypothetical protein